MAQRARPARASTAQVLSCHLALLALAACTPVRVDPGVDLNPDAPPREATDGAPSPAADPPATAGDEVPAAETTDSTPDQGDGRPLDEERTVPGRASASDRLPSDTLASDVGRAVAEPRRWSERLLDALTLEEKVGQMIMPSVLGDFSPEGSERHVRDVMYVEELGVGGVVMSVGSPTEVAAKLNDLQRHAEHPLLVAADLETGVGFRMRGAVHAPSNIDLGGATEFPTLMALGASGDTALAYEMGRVTALEARALGIHVPFAPVLDVNSNPENPIINVRSFGEDPDLVARLGVAFTRGMQDYGVLATGKHFPGHGDTDTDSHLEVPVVPHDRARLDSIELRPFRAAIEAGIGGVMTAHVAAPALNGGGRVPSTLSSVVLTDLLRDSLGFGGILFTDAMDMGAIDRRLGPREASVRAVEAGADVILMPPSVELARDAIVGAVRSGRIPEARIDASVLRILALKEGFGLHERRDVPIERIGEVVGIPEHLEVADRIAERSITLLRNRRDLLPLLGTRSARVMSVTYRRPSDILAGRYFDARLRRTYPRLLTAEVDEDTNPVVYDGLLAEARRQALVVVSTYVTVQAYTGSVSLPDDFVDFVRRLEETGRPHVVVSFGNPYLISQFPDVRAYMLAWGRSDASQRAAARALLGEFEITGRVPTAIPPFFQMGEGIRVPARGRRGRGG